MLLSPCPVEVGAFPESPCSVWSGLKSVVDNVSILQFLEAFNVVFDLQCAFSWIRVMTQLSVWREVFTMTFTCDEERSKAVYILGHYWRSVEQFHVCQEPRAWLRLSCLAHPSPAAGAVSVGGICRP